MPDKKKPASKRPPKTALTKPMPDMPGGGKLDQKLVDTAVGEINRLHRAKKIEAVQAIGQFVLKTFFDDNLAYFHSHGRKHASFRALAKHEDLTVSYVTIRNAVAFVEQLKMLPARVASALPYSHHKLLLPVATPEAKKELAEKAVEKEMSKRDLEQEVRKIRAKPGVRRGPGRRPDPAFVLAFRRLEKIAAMAASETPSTSVFVKFPAEDASRLAAAAEKHLAKIGEVVVRVKACCEEFKKKVEAEKGG